ncbi:MAG: NAD-dependent succinate-semialdehyde dehydrogenase [Chitinophagales bacterium]
MSTKIFKSINPYNLVTIAEYEELNDQQIQNKLQKADEAYKHWSRTSFENRGERMLKIAKLLKSETDRYARTITAEMGKPITQARAEIEKCAWVCEYYAKNAEKFLKDKHIQTDASESWVSYESIGCVMAIMPWNYPFWQFFRYAAPTIMAGNVGILKHASNVFGCAIQMEEIFLEADFPEGVFQNLTISSDKVAGILEDKRVKAVTLTGSEGAGSAVASKAGKHIKKSVLELGGSNAFVVLDDADIDQAVEVGYWARLQNTGQSCIAAKRFILQEGIAEEFMEGFKTKFEAMQVGNPIEEDTKIGPMARADLAEELEEQMQKSIDKGAKVLVGGNRTDAKFTPTILTNVKKGMPAFNEELFGPVASVFTVKTDEEAVNLANATNFGLGDSLCTSNMERAKKLIPHFEGGAVFVNELVKSDPRLPFGGTKISGYGRELSENGIMEFVNKKTVYIK